MGIAHHGRATSKQRSPRNLLPPRWRDGLRHPWVVGAVMLAVGVGVGASAAPFKPRRVKVPDEVRSLKGIRQVHLQIDPLLGAIGAAGVQNRELRAMMVSRLHAAGIEVVEEPITPRLVLKCLPLNNPKIPDTTALVMFLQIKQDVHLKRLHEPMILPTTTILGPSLTKRDDLASAVRGQCAFVLKNFIQFARLGERQPRKPIQKDDPQAEPTSPPAGED